MNKLFSNILKSGAAMLLGVFILILANTVANLVDAFNLPLLLRSALFSLIYASLTFVLLSSLAKFIFKMKPEDYFISNFKISPQWIIIAFFLPIFTIVLFFLINGELRQNIFDSKEILTLILSDILEMSIGVALVEEMIFRGFILKAFDKYLGKKAALVIPSILFSSVHFIFKRGTFGEMTAFLVSASVVGILLSLITYKNSSIWPSVFIHFIWNMFMCGNLFHVAKDFVPYTIFSYKLKAASSFVTGGIFGGEASIITAFIFILTIIYILKRKKYDY